MLYNLSRIFVAMLIPFFMMGVTGCWESDTENKAEDMAEQVEESTEEAGESIEDTAEEAGESIEDKTEEMTE